VLVLVLVLVHLVTVLFEGDALKGSGKKVNGKRQQGNVIYLSLSLDARPHIHHADQCMSGTSDCRLHTFVIETGSCSAARLLTLSAVNHVLELVASLLEYLLYLGTLGGL
jgi:hypothetical protein